MIRYALTVSNEDHSETVEVHAFLGVDDPEEHRVLGFEGPPWAEWIASETIIGQMGRFHPIKADTTALDLAEAMTSPEVLPLNPRLVEGSEILTKKSRIHRTPKPGPILKYRLRVPPDPRAPSREDTPDRDIPAGVVYVWLQPLEGETFGPIRYDGALEDIRRVAPVVADAHGHRTFLSSRPEPEELKFAMRSDWLSGFSPELVEDSLTKK